MKLVMQRKNPSARWLAPLALLYLIGGSIQYIGILSPTQCTIVLLALFCHVFFYRSTWRIALSELPILIFLAFVLIYHLANKPPASNTLTYIYYLICTIVVSVAGRVYAFHLVDLESLKNFFRICRWFLVIQLAVTLFQFSFTETFVAFSRGSVNPVDAMFGSLFLKSDASLAAICQLIVIAAFLLPCLARERFLLTVLAILIIFIANSKAAQGSILLLIALLSVRQLGYSVGFQRYGFGILGVAAAILCAAVTFPIWSDYVSAFLTRAQEDYFRRDEWVSASRFAPIGEMVSKRLDVFGQGPLTYYNPITKTWLYNSGFSTIYMLYIDYGALGLALFLFYVARLVFKFASKVVPKLAFFLVITTFIIFNFALWDAGFLFFLNFILALNYKINREVVLEIQSDSREGIYALARD